MYAVRIAKTTGAETRKLLFIMNVLMNTDEAFVQNVIYLTSSVHFSLLRVRIYVPFQFENRSILFAIQLCRGHHAKKLTAVLFYK